MLLLLSSGDADNMKINIISNVLWSNFGLVSPLTPLRWSLCFPNYALSTMSEQLAEQLFLQGFKHRLLHMLQGHEHIKAAIWAVLHHEYRVCSCLGKKYIFLWGTTTTPTNLCVNFPLFEEFLLTNTGLYKQDGPETLVPSPSAQFTLKPFSNGNGSSTSGRSTVYEGWLLGLQTWLSRVVGYKHWSNKLNTPETSFCYPNGI